MGRLVGQQGLRARAGCCSRATTTAPSAAGRPDAAGRRGGAARFEALAAAAPGRVERRARRRRRRRRAGPSRATAPAELAAARFDRRLDAGWRRTSYSDITAGAHEARVASEPEEPVVADEPAAPARRRRRRAGGAATGDGRRCARVPSLLAGMPAGVARRHVRAPRARGDRLRRARPRRRARRAVGRGAGAPAASTSATPARSSPGCGRRSRRRSGRCSAARGCATSPAPTGWTSSASSCRWPAGTSPTAGVVLGAIGAVLREHLPAGDPLAGYAERLDDPALRQAVRGYLTGSIDLVVRSAPATAPASPSSTTRRTGSPRRARS